jgi:hypothetical protein
MKTKKNKKKLVLNKISIARLDNDKMDRVKSGGIISPPQTEHCPINNLED